MNTKTLLTIISVTEILLLVVVDILGNKLAELIHLDPIVILGITLVLVAILVWITFSKFRVADSKTFTISLPKPKIRLTQQGMKKFLWWLTYGPFALMLSGGAFYLSKELDENWPALLPSIAVSATLLAFPTFREQAVEQGHKILPLLIAWILSVIYGMVGFLLLLTPELLETHLLVFIMVSATTMTGLKYAYIFHLIEIVFEPWFKKLPEN